MDVVEWLMDSDPAIRWQVMRDLTDASADALNRLRQAGLVITGQQGNMIHGHIPVANLETLSKLPNVQRIFPW